jgi:hypothetical protein
VTPAVVAGAVSATLHALFDERSFPTVVILWVDRFDVVGEFCLVNRTASVIDALSVTQTSFY